MQADHFVVSVNSEQPERLTDFYRNAVGLKPGPIPGALMAGSSPFFALIIGDHSELKGPAKEPQRVMLNFFLRDLASEEARLKGLGVKFIKNATKQPGATVATFLDPDGNYCQLLQLEQ